MNIRMGDYLPTAPPKTTPGGILYYSFGLDDYGPKRIKKACRRMTEAGVAEYIIAEFREWGLRLPAELATWIDTAYGERMADFRACIGHYLPNGDEITASKLDRLGPDKLRVILHPEPFDAGGTITAGAAWSDRIEAVIAYLDSGNTWLRRCDKLAEWEIGNFLARNCGYSPRDARLETGNRKPCG